MKNFVSIVVAASTASAFLTAPVMAQEPQPEPIEVMVLGTYHFANPGRDMINVETDDVLVPERQAELQAISDALAHWRPTRILIEAQPATEDLHMPSYRTNAAELIADDRNESYQIGYRLALQLGLEDVYGFDEQPDAGEPDYFPMGAVQQWAEDNGRMDDLVALTEQVRTIVEGIAADDADCSIAHNLMQQNDADVIVEAHGAFYYGAIPFGDADAQPGAELNAYWYMRNAKMFAKIGLVDEPGDRVLVIVGAGHKYWLDHFVDLAEGYEAVDPRSYLELADDGRCR